MCHLLSNAAKFTPEGGHVTVEVVCHRADATVRVSIRDTGVGIPADELGRIVEPFARVDVFSSRAEQGIGLGLTVSRGLSRGTGGELEVESTPGVGSRFLLRLPQA